MSCKEYIRDLDRPPEKVYEVFGLSEEEGDRIIKELWEIAMKEGSRQSDLVYYAKEKYDGSKLLYAIYIAGAIKGYLDCVSSSPVILIEPSECNPTSIGEKNNNQTRQKLGLSM